MVSVLEIIYLIIVIRYKSMRKECKYCEKGMKPSNGYHMVLDTPADPHLTAYMSSVRCLVTAPLPKKSKKVKKETKVQELERRIKALEAHRCNPVPQQPPYNPYPNVPPYGWCRWCNNTPCLTGYHVIC